MRDDIVNREAMRKADNARKKIRDRRRVHVTHPATGVISKTAPKNAERTLFENRLVDPVVGDDVLLDGAFNRKIGGDVMAGRLRGARIKTLSLEERRTCPETCQHWRTCYGNSMSRAKRFRHGPDLEAAIQDQMRRYFDPLSGKRRRKVKPLLVRLHVLGDFYSLAYLRTWVELLDQYPDLHVFGFTAWQPGTEIGDAISRVRDAIPDKFAVRTSGTTGRWGSFTIDWPTEKRFLHVNGETSIVCPEQLDANSGGKREKHCGNCTACWQSDIAVTFIEH